MTPQQHVLVAEDNALVAGAMRVVFEETGRRVTTTAEVGETVDACADSPVDLLLLDHGLADGDGFQVLAQLAARGVMPRVVIGLTGRDEPELVERLRGAGCRVVMLKPVPLRELLAVVARELARVPLSF